MASTVNIYISLSRVVVHIFHVFNRLFNAVDRILPVHSTLSRYPNRNG